jgi:hypothetical protein
MCNVLLPPGVKPIAVNKKERKEKEVPAPRDTIPVTFRAESILTVDNTCASLIE